MDTDIPDFLHSILLKEYDEKYVNKIIEGFSKKRKTTLRVNTIKTTIEIIKETLLKHDINFEEVSWNKNALIIQNRNEEAIRKLEMYKNGEIYMQSLSSMMPVIALEPKEGENILDMTAAPGGKTTQIASYSNNKAMITACEKNKIRAERLKYNIEKQNAERINIIVQDARELDDFFRFDKILLDAPCSGSGTLNTLDKSLKTKFTQDLVERSIKTQSQLLNKAIKILKNGGEMIYSTCSILKEENEKNLSNIIKKNNLEVIPIHIQNLENITLLPVEIDGTICICPDELYEGFFIAKLRKK